MNRRELLLSAAALALAPVAKAFELPQEERWTGFFWWNFHPGDQSQLDDCLRTHAGVVFARCRFEGVRLDLRKFPRDKALFCHCEFTDCDLSLPSNRFWGFTGTVEEGFLAGG